MRYDLLEHIDPRLAGLIEGTTDTEWVYALVLSQLAHPFGPTGAEEAAGAVSVPCRSCASCAGGARSRRSRR